MRLPFNYLKKINAPMVGFSEDSVIVEEEVTLLVTIG